MTTPTREQVVQILRDAKCSFADGEILKMWLPSMTRVIEKARADLEAQLKAAQDQLASAEQRTAEACADLSKQIFDSREMLFRPGSISDAIRAGEWRKFVKGE